MTQVTEKTGFYNPVFSFFVRRGEGRHILDKTRQRIYYRYDYAV